MNTVDKLEIKLSDIERRTLQRKGQIWYIVGVFVGVFATHFFPDTWYYPIPLGVVLLTWYIARLNSLRIKAVDENMVNVRY